MRNLPTITYCAALTLEVCTYRGKYSGGLWYTADVRRLCTVLLTLGIGVTPSITTWKLTSLMVEVCSGSPATLLTGQVKESVGSLHLRENFWPKILWGRKCMILLFWENSCDVYFYLCRMQTHRLKIVMILDEVPVGQIRSSCNSHQCLLLLQRELLEKCI